MKTLSFLIIILYLNVFADDISLTNGYVLRNVKVDNKKGPDKTWVLSGRDVQIFVPDILISIQNVKNVDDTTVFIYEPDPGGGVTDFQKSQKNKSNDSLFVITRSGERIHYNTFSSSESSVTFKTNYGTVIISKPLIVSNGQVESEPSALTNKPQNLVIVSMLNGESFQGEFLSSTDSTVTYQTSAGSIIVIKKDILTVRKISKDFFYQSPASNPERRSNKILIKEYNSLPLLILPVAGVVGAILWFGDAKDYSDAADILNGFGLKNAADEASTKSNEKLLLGIGASVLSLIFLVVAVTPSEHYIDQPVAFIPTANGIRVVVQF
jgi:hypothetical protein